MTKRHVTPHPQLILITAIMAGYPKDLPCGPDEMTAKIAEQLKQYVSIDKVKEVAETLGQTWPAQRAAAANKKNKLERLGRGGKAGISASDFTKNRVRCLARVVCQLVTNLHKSNPDLLLLDEQHVELLLRLRNNTPITDAPEQEGSTTSVSGTAVSGTRELFPQ